VTLALGEDERALVVHFWASWCPECGEELPGLERAVRDCAGEVRVVAVNVAEPADVARRFLERHASALPLFRDPDGRVWRRLARGLPANLIWTRASRRVEVGPKDPSEWGRLLSSLGCRSMKIP
jgi:thiol-disulfide isomerase/thioredoxin